MTAFAGIDYDTHRLHVVVIADGHHPYVGQAKLRERQATPYDATRGVLAGLNRLVSAALDDLDPFMLDAAVERGWGASRRSDFLLGSIYGAVVASWSCVASRSPRIGGIQSVPTADWKRTLGVAGNARKETANAAAADLWASMWGTPAPGDPNLLDAFALALVAREAAAT